MFEIVFSVSNPRVTTPGQNTIVTIQDDDCRCNNIIGSVV